MRRSYRTWLIAAAACGALTVASCKPESIQNLIGGKESEIPPAKAPPAASPAGKSELARTPKAEPPPRPTIPKVVLSDSLRDACLVKVDDDLPDGELTALDGNFHFLSGAYHQARVPVSVVCFWSLGDSTRSHKASTQILKDLMKDVVEPYGERVRVIGVNEGDKMEAVQKHVQDAGITFPILLDTKGDILVKLAKDKQLPRVYLVSPSNVILWFDVEFSRASRQDLLKGIRVALGEEK